MWPGSAKVLYQFGQFEFNTTNICLSLGTLADGTGVYFSAVCWLYGKYLYQELGYPIGLIDTSYGGTPIEAWSSRDALGQCGISSTEIVESFMHMYENICRDMSTVAILILFRSRLD